MASKRDLNRIKELKVEIPYYGELSTSESKEKESYKKLVVGVEKGTGIFGKEGWEEEGLSGFFRELDE